MRRCAIGIGIVALLAGSATSCRTAKDACESFVEAVEECQGGPDDHYNQAYCDQSVEGGCDDRRYYTCLEDHLSCTNGQASTTPIICQVAADAVCPGD